jgi:hypothetical protein
MIAISLRSWGGAVMVAMVERMRAGLGKRPPCHVTRYNK